MNAKIKTLFLAITLTLVFAFGDDGNEPPDRCIPNPTGRWLTVTRKEQKQTFWCWAACGEMVMAKVGTSAPQCDQATKKFGQACCPPGNNDQVCNHGGFPDFKAYGLLSDSIVNDSMTWEQIQFEIDCREKPFCASWKDGGNGHMVVVSGYKLRGDEQLVKIIDPWENVRTRLYTYEYYVAPTSGQIHWKDYYNLRPQ
jgi:hypothetical protein